MNVKLKGAFVGFVSIVILLLVPIIGVRKLSHLVMNWQELVLYITCLAGGLISGARVAVIQSADAAKNALLITTSEREPERSREEMRIETATSESSRGAIETIETRPGEGGRSESAPAEAAASEDTLSEHTPDEEPPMKEPQIELSLAGGPKKIRSWSLPRPRTKVLIASLYLILYVSCAALCQKLNTGSLVLGSLKSEIVRNLGLGLCLLGIYLAIRGLFRTTDATGDGASPKGRAERRDATGNGALSIDRKERDNATADGVELEDRRERGEIAAEPAAVLMKRPDAMTHSPSQKESHVPPTRLAFLKEHPVCSGWIVIVTGLPLVFLAWFPLLAIPGIFVGMNWLFGGRTDAWRPERSQGF